VIGDVLVTGKAKPATPELAAAVCETMKKTHNAVIPHHGAVFIGPSIEVAYRIAEAAEIKARNILGYDAGTAAEDTEE
jgi:ribulose-5-phosphate 4-epimerase/fuculose-1-phosphate aldolase